MDIVQQRWEGREPAAAAPAAESKQEHQKPSG